MLQFEEGFGSGRGVQLGSFFASSTPTKPEVVQINSREPNPVVFGLGFTEIIIVGPQVMFCCTASPSNHRMILLYCDMMTATARVVDQ